MTEPRTEAGRDLVRNWTPNHGRKRENLTRFVLAIEAEAAALDTERLARALDLSGSGAIDGHLPSTWAVIDEYARLSDEP